METRQVMAAAIGLEAAANGHDADTAYPGLLEPGDSVAWTYQVANPGDARLTNVVLVDDQGTPDDPTDDLIPIAQVTPTAPLGTLEATLSLGIHKFVLHPTQPYMYGTVPGTNSLAIINTLSLSVEQVFIGSNPRGLGISADGNRVYVANASSQFMGVFDTVNRITLPSLQLPEIVRDVEVGLDGRLYVVGNTGVQQIDANTGARIGNYISRDNAAEVEISPARDRLYAADYGTSPASLYQFDLTVDPPRQLWTSPHGGTSGSNGQDLAISHDGTFISYAAGAGQIGYTIAKYRTSDMAITGTFDTGPYPTEIAFSPDNKLAFTINSSGSIKLWDTTTFASKGTITTPAHGNNGVELAVDRSGRRLFASLGDGKVYVYNTGQASGLNIGDLNSDAVLDPGETWSYASTKSARPGKHVYTITVTGTTADVVTVSATDLTSVATRGWSMTADVTVPAAQANAGQVAIWNYSATNTGVFDLANVSFQDDRGTANALDDASPAYQRGDENLDGLLNPGEVWQFALAGSVHPGSVGYRATLQATPVDGTGIAIAAPFTAYDSVDVFGVVTDLAIEVSVNNDPANSSPGPTILAGSQITLNYEITNNGNAPLGTISVVDGTVVPETVTPSASLGTLVKVFPGLTAKKFVLHPTLPYLYATIGNKNSLAVINTDTLQLMTEVFIGSGPHGIAISPDGGRVYVANATSAFIGVFDTESGAVLPSIQYAERVLDVEVGADGRLYVLGEDSLAQIDPATGAAVGSPFDVFVYSGELEINPQKSRLYYGDYGLSPASLYQFDITVNPPLLLWESPHGGTSGSNGQDLDISNDGSFIAYPAGAGQVGYSIAKYRTSDMLIEGVFPTGAYPREITFSPDDMTAYTVNTRGAIDLWSTRTFLKQGTIIVQGEASELFVDRGGKYLFAAFSDELRIYDTGVGSAYNVGDIDRDNLLDPGESWRYRRSTSAEAGEQMHIATTTAMNALGDQIQESDVAYYAAVGLSLVFDSYLNADDADVPPGLEVNVASAGSWGYRVTNIGTVPAGNWSLTDDNGTTTTSDDFSPSLIGGDVNANNVLDVGETWQFAAARPLVTGARTHSAAFSAVVVDVNGVAIEGIAASTFFDKTHYIGRTGNLAVELTVNGLPADHAPGVEVFVGKPLQWSTTISNAGDLPLSNVQLRSDNGTPQDESDDTFLPLATASVPQGVVEQTFASLGSVSEMLAHPTLPLLFATIGSTNSVAIINTDTLQLIENVFIGSGPKHMALSLDGKLLYVANTQSNFIGVLDTQTHQSLAPIMVPELARDVEVGADGRLYVLGPNSLRQIDPSTGLSVGAIFNLHVYGGEIELNPQRTRLYYGDSGLSPPSVYQFDITVNPPALLWDSPHANIGIVGTNLAVSHDGTLVTGDGGTLLRAQGMATLGTFNLGTAGPAASVFSLDDTRVYTIGQAGKIDIRNTTTFLNVAQIATVGTAYELELDHTGQHLFAAFDGELRVYATTARSVIIGDNNGNHLLDPGEAWHYSDSSIAASGAQQRMATVTAVDSLGNSIAVSDPAHYLGVLQIDIIESIGTRSIIDIKSGDAELIVLDERFELVGGQLQLKPDASLSAASEPQMTLEIRRAADGGLVHKVIVNVLASSSKPWQNADNAGDVDGDGTIAPFDVLLIIVELNASGTRDLFSVTFVENRRFLDVDANGVLSPLDALLVIIQLNAREGGQLEPLMPMTDMASHSGAVDAGPVALFDPSWLFADDDDDEVATLLALDRDRR